MRALLHRYRFAGPEERERGVWWTADPLGLWGPALTLAEDGGLVLAR